MKDRDYKKLALHTALDLIDFKLLMSEIGIGACIIGIPLVWLMDFLVASICATVTLVAGIGALILIIWVLADDKKDILKQIQEFNNEKDSEECNQM